MLSKGFTYRLFILGLIISSAYFCYARFLKVTHSGLQVDETVHVRFATDLRTALDRYPNAVLLAPEADNRYLGTANHSANYAAIYLTRRVFDILEISPPVWYQRIPILLASLMFIIAFGFLIPKLFHSKALGFFTFLFFASNYAIFDLMIIARGYGYQIASFMVVIWSWIGIRSLLKSHLFKKKFLSGILFVFLLIVHALATSFAIGSLLPAVVPFFVLHHFFAFFLYFEYRKEKKRYIPVLIFTLASDLLVFLICRYIYYFKFKAMLNIARFVPTHESSKLFFDEITSFYFVDPLKVISSSSNSFLYVFLFLLLSWATIFFLENKRSDYLRSIPINPERAYLRRVLLTSSIVLPTILAAAIDIFNRNVGESRHQPILAILFALGIFFSLDRIILHAGRINMKIKQILIPSICIVLASYTYILRYDPLINKAYPGWDIQSATGILLNKLKAIDPEREWGIHVGEGSTMWNSLIIDYYRSFGFNANSVKRDEDFHDFQMCSTFDSKDICHPQYPRFEKDFFEPFNLSIADKRK